MINNTSLSVEPASCWRLQADFWATSLPGLDRQLADQVTEIMRELGLLLLQLERIQKSVLEAVQRASLRGQMARPASPVHIRIWVPGERARGNRWGFFLVEKSGSDLLGAPAETEYLVELFLYQERDS